MGFTDEEIRILKKSPYIDNVFKHKIDYGKLFYQEYWRIRQLGYTGKDTFDFLGLDPNIVGTERIRSLEKRVKRLVQNNELYDENNQGTVSIVQQLNEKDSEIKRLRQEVEFLKKKKMLDWKYKT